MRLTCVVGARPNFMKVAPVLRAAERAQNVQTRLVHTGQHYDERLSKLFFDELGLPEPHAYLGVGSGSHAAQTARVMMTFDEDLDTHPTDVVVVVGDVNSTIACALVAVKRGIAVAHIEAGLRSRDRTMPEEINRLLTDQISDYLFTTERSAGDNLLSEGIPADKIHFVGNVMIDTLLEHRDRAAQRGILQKLALRSRDYALCTLHRPSNVDTIADAENTVRVVQSIASRIPVLLPLHPRTRTRLATFGLLEQMEQSGISIVDPLGYLDFLALMDNARLVFTDSGGVQEETTVLGVPCLTFRENTERPITVTEGTNRIVGTDSARVAAALDDVLKSDGRGQHRVPELWDGRSADRILQVLITHASNRPGDA